MVKGGKIQFAHIYIIHNKGVFGMKKIVEEKVNGIY
jgi:hypothetical protein